MARTKDTRLMLAIASDRYHDLHTDSRHILTAATRLMNHHQSEEKALAALTSSDAFAVAQQLGRQAEHYALEPTLHHDYLRHMFWHRVATLLLYATQARKKSRH